MSGTAIPSTNKSDVNKDPLPALDEVTENPAAAVQSSSSEKADEHTTLKPIWNKLLKGLNQRKTAKPFVVWDSMIKKLNRIRAYQKSNQEAVISDMFHESTEVDEEQSEQDAPIVQDKMGFRDVVQLSSMRNAANKLQASRKDSITKDQRSKIGGRQKGELTKHLSSKEGENTLWTKIKHKIDVDKSDKVSRPGGKSDTEDEESDAAFRKELAFKEEAGSNTTLSGKNPPIAEKKKARFQKNADAKDLARFRRASFTDPNRVTIDENDKDALRYNRRYGFLPKARESELMFDDDQEKQKAQRKLKKYFDKMARNERDKSGPEWETNWKQQGLGKFIKEQMNFDDDWFSGFRVASARRRKSKEDVYFDPFKKMKKGKNLFKTFDEPTKSRNRRQEYEKQFRKQFDFGSSDDDFDYSLGRRGKRGRGGADDYHDPFGRMKSPKHRFKKNREKSSGSDYEDDMSSSFKRRKGYTSDDDFGFSIARRGKRPKSGNDVYADPFGRMRSPKYRLNKMGGRPGSGTQRSTDQDESDLAYLFRRSPMNADRGMEYDFDVKGKRRKRSKTDLYYDPFGKMKTSKSPKLKGRPNSSPKYGAKSPREADDMDLIFKRSPRNADSDMLYEYGVTKNKRKRSKTDLYVDPFRKMKSPKSAWLGKGRPPSRKGDSSQWQFSKDEDDQGRPERPMITVVDEPALWQYQDELSGKKFNRLGATATGYDKASYYRDKMMNYRSDRYSKTGVGPGTGAGPKTKFIAGSEQAVGATGLVDQSKTLGKADSNKNKSSKDFDKETKKSGEEDVSAMEIEKDKKNDLLHLHLIGGVPTYSFHYSSYDKINRSISGVVAEAEQKAEQEKEGAEVVKKTRKEKSPVAAQSPYKYKPILTQYYDVADKKPKVLEKDEKGSDKNKVTLPIDAKAAEKKLLGLNKDEGKKKGKDLFFMELQDGSNAIFYPKTAAVAIAGISATDKLPQNRYVHCYDGDAEGIPLAKFSPAGKSWCYDKRSGRKLSWFDEGIALRAKNGKLMYKWNWPEGTGNLKKPLNFQMNKELSVRVIGRNQTILKFKSNDDTINFPVGPIADNLLPPDVPEVPTNNSILRFITSLRAALAYENVMQQKESRFPKKTLQSKTNKRPSLVKDLKETLVAKETKKDDEKTAATEEANKTAENLAEGWLAYRRRYFSDKGITDKEKPEKETVSKPPEKPREKKKKPEGVKQFLPPDHNVESYQTYRSPSATPKHMLPGPFSVRTKTGEPKAPPVRSDSKKICLPPELQPGFLKSTTPADSADPSQLKLAVSDSALRPPAVEQFTKIESCTSDGLVQAVKSFSASDVRPKTRKGPRKRLECGLCPVVARRKLISLGKNEFLKSNSCPCSVKKIPLILDIEFDYFLHVVAPKQQLVVISVTNSLYPDASPYDITMECIYVEKNLTRAVPCSQTRFDQYRILKYDLAVAITGTARSIPLLLGRHNVVPGMALIYCQGRLMFADHIFDGFGNTKQDFLKQILKSKNDFAKGFSLPNDFCFTPLPGKSVGARSGYGGEIHGAGVKGTGLPGAYFGNDMSIKEKLVLLKKIKEVAYVPGKVASHQSSNNTSESSFTSNTPISKILLTAKDFVQYSLSARTYILQPTKTESNLAPVQAKQGKLLESTPGLYNSTTSSLQKFLPSVPKVIVETPRTMNFKPYSSIRSLA